LVLALAALSVTADGRTPTPMVEPQSGPDRIEIRRSERDQDRVRITVSEAGDAAGRWGGVIGKTCAGPRRGL
jgi:hypothetical protein